MALAWGGKSQTRKSLDIEPHSYICLSELLLMSCSADNGIADPSIANTAEAAGLPINNDESSRLLVGRDNRAAVIRRGKITMAALYAIQVFYSFFIM